MFTALPITIDLILAALVTEGIFMTVRFSAGPHTPAVADGYTWEVQNLQGAPMVLATNPFDAALWLLKLETGEIALSPSDAPVRLLSDVEIVLRDREDRMMYRQ